MVPGAGKRKGAAFEREVCTKLSLWVTAGKRKDCFWRSAMSGGRATVHAKKGGNMHSQIGDISAVAPEGHAFLKRFMIECKFIRDLNLQAAAVSGAGPLYDFWIKLALDAVRAGKSPLLIAKQNRLPTLVFARASETTKYFGPVSQIELARLFKLEGYRISVFDFDQLLETFPYAPDRYR